jgi:hypothetical protein
MPIPPSSDEREALACDWGRFRLMTSIALLAVAAVTLVGATTGASAQDADGNDGPLSTLRGTELPTSSSSSSSSSPATRANTSDDDQPFALLRGDSGPLLLTPPADDTAPLFDPSPMMLRTRDIGGGPLQPSLYGRLGPPSSTARTSVQNRVYADLKGEPPAATTPPRRRPKRPEDDPYEQLGVRLGGLIFLPSIEADIGYDSNPRRINTDVKGATMLRTLGEVDLKSDWERHSLTGYLRGAYDAFVGMSDVNRPSGDGLVNLKLDVLRGTQFESEGRFQLSTQQPGNPNLPNGVVNQPLTFTGGGTAGLVHTFNRLSIGAYGDIDRSIYGDAKLADGSTLSQEDRNYTQYALRLRTGYEISPFFSPFLEGRLDKRRYDNRIDDSGYARSSNGTGLSIGTTVNFNDRLTGEIAAGYERRVYDDPRLDDLNGPIGRASLVWNATPLTTVKLNASSTLGETTVVGSSGVVVRQAGIEVDHALRRNLTVTGTLDLTDNDYQGVYIKEHGLTGEVRLDWKLTRSLIFRASFTHDRLKSTAPDSDYTANVFLVGLRLQR